MTMGKPTMKFHPAEHVFGYSALRGLIALYARLTGRGKPHKAALTACARKLLIDANTVVQRQTPWTEKTAPI
jgi:transposase